MIFDDYGPYRGHPLDPRTPDDDDRSIDELKPSEQRSLLLKLSRTELVEQALEALADAALWQQKAGANEAKAMRYLTDLITYQARLKESQERLLALQAAIKSAQNAPA